MISQYKVINFLVELYSYSVKVEMNKFLRCKK